MYTLLIGHDKILGWILWQFYDLVSDTSHNIIYQIITSNIHGHQMPVQVGLYSTCNLFTVV